MSVTWLTMLFFLIPDMPRNYQKKNKFFKYTDEDLQKAVEMVSSGRLSQNKAAKQFKIPRGTLQNRLNGRLSHTGKIGPRPVPVCSTSSQLPSTSGSKTTVGSGTWVVVRYRPRGSKVPVHYVAKNIGLLEDVVDHGDSDHSDNEEPLYRVSMVRKSPKIDNAFVWPDVDDLDAVKPEAIVAILPTPVMDRRGHFHFAAELLAPFRNIR